MKPANRRGFTSQSVARLGAAALACALAGCASVGPGTVAVDRFDYS